MDLWVFGDMSRWFVTGFWQVVDMRFGESNGRAGSGRPEYRVRVVLPSIPIGEASPTDLKELMRSASEAESQVAAFRARATAEYSRRMGRKHAEKTLREVSGKSSRGARTEVKIAHRLKDLPGTRRAFEEGQITAGHVQIIAKTSERVEIDEQDLVKKAKRQPVDVFARAARRHEQQRAQDDGVSKLEAQKRSRRAWIRTDRDDGMTMLYARFDPITGAAVKNALSTRAELLWREEDSNRRPSTEQRLADALAQLVSEPRDLNGGGKSWGATLFIMAHYDVIAQQLRDASLADGTPIPVEVLKDLACQARIVPAFFDARRRPLWVGRSRRLATYSQRMALIARDRGCVGCSADPDWCQAHHVIPWQADGPTDIENLCLLCSRCHHQVHDDGWLIRQTPTGQHVMLPPSTPNRPPLPVKTPQRQRPPRRRREPVRRTAPGKTDVGNAKEYPP